MHDMEERVSASRSFQATDMDAVAALVNGCSLGGEGAVEDKSRQALIDEMTAPHVDRERDLRVWPRDGELRAFARLAIEPVAGELQGRLYYAIGALEDAALEREIIGWAAARMLERRGEAPVRLVHAIGVRDPEREARLEALGWCRYRRYLEMSCALDQPVAEPALPPGHVLRPCRGVEDAARYVELFNASFVDTRDFAPLEIEDFVHDLASPDYRAERDLVLEDAAGTLLGLCFSMVDADTPHLGYVASLAVRRGARERGLGRAMLLGALARLRRDGVRHVHLRVDADSLTGATRLYERVGFTLRYVETRLALDERGIQALPH